MMLLPISSELLVKSLAWAGPMFTVALQASSLQCALKMHSEQNTMGMSLVPFTSLLANSIVWSCYGLLQYDNVILIPNAIGVCTGIVCMLLYSNTHKALDAVSFAAITVTALASGWAVAQKNSSVLGSMGCVLAVILLAAPLVNLQKVLTDKSTSSMSLPVSLSAFGNALSWTLYGFLIAHDPMIFAPSIVGLLTTIAQLALFAVFRTSNKNRNDTANFPHTSDKKHNHHKPPEELF